MIRKIILVTLYLFSAQRLEAMNAASQEIIVKIANKKTSLYPKNFASKALIPHDLLNVLPAATNEEDSEDRVHIIKGNNTIALAFQSTLRLSNPTFWTANDLSKKDLNKLATDIFKKNYTCLEVIMPLTHTDIDTWEGWERIDIKNNSILYAKNK